MHGSIFGSRGQQVGYRSGMEVFNMREEKLFDVDFSGNLLEPNTKQIVGHLHPVDASLPNEKSLDHLFA